MEANKSSSEWQFFHADLGQSALGMSVSVVTALVLLVAGFIIAGWVSRSIRHHLAKIDKFDRTMIPILAQIGRYAVLVFTVVLVLAEFGVQTASIIAVLGAAGIAIGLALQGTLQNVASGMMLLLLRPFQVGDYIEAGGKGGTVKEIGLFMTRMLTPHGIFLAMPNNRIWSDVIINYTRMPSRRLDLEVGISYDDDIDRAVDILKGLLEADERVLDEPAPAVIVKALGESSVNLEIRAWANLDVFWPLNWDLTRAVKYALDEAGIAIPYPHRQVVLSEAEPRLIPAA